MRWVPFVAILGMAGCGTLYVGTGDPIQAFGDKIARAYGVTPLPIEVTTYSRAISAGGMFHGDRITLPPGTAQAQAWVWQYMIAHEYGHYLLQHHRSKPKTLAEQQQRELEADAKAVEILTRAEEMPEAEALLHVFAFYSQSQRALDLGARQAAGHPPFEEKVRYLCKRFPASAPAVRECRGRTPAAGASLVVASPPRDPPTPRVPSASPPTPHLPTPPPVVAAPSPSRPPTHAVPAPVWNIGDEWSYRWESPRGKGTFVWVVEHEQRLADVDYYVIKSGRRMSYWRKTDLAFYLEKFEGAFRTRYVPPLILAVWPLAPGSRWDQTYTHERLQDRESEEIRLVCQVESEEQVIVPAGTFRAFKIQCRHKSTGTISFEWWYAPEVKQMVRDRTYFSYGVRERELTNYELK